MIFLHSTGMVFLKMVSHMKEATGTTQLNLLCLFYSKRSDKRTLDGGSNKTTDSRGCLETQVDEPWCKDHIYIVVCFLLISLLLIGGRSLWDVRFHFTQFQNAAGYSGDFRWHLTYTTSQQPYPIYSILCRTIIIFCLHIYINTDMSFLRILRSYFFSTIQCSSTHISIYI